MDIKTFQTLAGKLPPEIAILMRGPTGVGKSQMARALAEELDLPFLDVRGSTMDESQVSGIPDFETSKTAGVATFCLPSFYVRACREPVVLMLDELNRSMPQVMQSFFQIVLDRELGNNVDGEPLRLHPETRVVAAVNWGNEYDVSDMDPALLRRFWVVDLEPTSQDWLDWAVDTGVDSVLVDFVRQNPEHLRVDPGSVEPGTVIPTPASWDRLNKSLVHMGMAPSDICGTRPQGFYPLCAGFVGMEAAIAFSEFVANYERVISAEDVMEGRVTAQRAQELSASEALGVVEKLVASCQSEMDWTNAEAENACGFIESLGGEQLVHFWNKASKGNKNQGNVKKIHKLIGLKVTQLVRAAKNMAN